MDSPRISSYYSRHHEMLKFCVVVALASLASVKGLMGGKNVDITIVPYQVYVSHTSEVWDCSGAIISEFWIVTSGQCGQMPLSGVTIHAGSSHRKEGGSRHTIAFFKIHEAFDCLFYADILVHDIALIKVNEPFEFGPTRRAIELFNAGEEARPGTEAVVSSWGDQENSPGAYFLRIINVTIVDSKHCYQLYASLNTILDNQICGGYSGGTEEGMCFGDTGAPLVINGRLAGLFSWGTTRAVGRKPGVYTEIAAYRDWIKRHTGI